MNTTGANVSGTSLPFLKAGARSLRVNGRLGQGTVANPGTGSNPSYVDASQFLNTTDGSLTTAQYYTFSTIARTSPLGLQSPANYNLDISLRRTVNLHVTEASRVTIEGDYYNVTNHTLFGGIGTVVGSSNFGQVSSQSNLPRDAQLSARIEF